MIIGCDFDNTIADYEKGFARLAKEFELISQDFVGSKNEVRDHLRSIDGGEMKWQALQGQIYGNYIHFAKVMMGFESFLKTAKSNGAKITIISHKTEFGHFDEKKTNLRIAAVNWIKKNGLFDYFEDIQFGATRDEKAEIIKKLSPDIFIDDLPEVFNHPNFPISVKQILFSKSDNDWKMIRKQVFDV
jgi:hypothetical protein